MCLQQARSTRSAGADIDHDRASSPQPATGGGAPTSAAAARAADVPWYEEAVNAGIKVEAFPPDQPV